MPMWSIRYQKYPHRISKIHEIPSYLSISMHRQLHQILTSTSNPSVFAFPAPREPPYPRRPPHVSPETPERASQDPSEIHVLTALRFPSPVLSHLCPVSSRGTEPGLIVSDSISQDPVL